MALIQCPECDQAISDKALKCPKCGYPIQNFLNREERSEKKKISFSLKSIKGGKIKKKTVMLAVLGVLVIIITLASARFVTSNPKVKDISITKWRIVDSTKYSDNYEGTVISEQKKPFVAVIGQYNDDNSKPNLVYVEDGKGVFRTNESSDKDPSVIYKAIGYINGTTVKSSDVKLTYKDKEYTDYESFDFTTCNVLITGNLNPKRTGILVFDLINERDDKIETNCIAPVVDGKIEYYHFAHVPYKSRGIEVTLLPKFFCKSTVVSDADYEIEKPYTAVKYEGERYSSYSGNEELHFHNITDGYIIYTAELKEGGNKENRDKITAEEALLKDGVCTLETYDSVKSDVKILMPKYDFNVVGYVSWETLEKETP